MASGVRYKGSDGAWHVAADLTEEYLAGGQAGQVWTSDGVGAGGWADPSSKTIFTGDVKQLYTVDTTKITITIHQDFEVVFMGTGYENGMGVSTLHVKKGVYYYSPVAFVGHATKYNTSDDVYFNVLYIGNNMFTVGAYTRLFNRTPSLAYTRVTTEDFKVRTYAIYV